MNTTQNLKQVNDIWLATVAQDVDTFTVAQATGLYTIANQCPMVGGNAVYTARALYRLIDDSQEYDDPLLCSPHGITVKAMEREEEAMAIYPNPARDEVTLVLGKELQGMGRFVVYNAVGATVLQAPLAANILEHVVGTGPLAPGLYQYKVLGPSGVVGTGKLVILH